jgi:prolyl-tRNA editing enzyme YbaK/EbsC (Cys-tRNA(Pro) deacylase)
VSLPRSARRVQEALRRHGLDADIVQTPDSARTAPEAALAVGCEVGAIVKSLVFRGTRTGDPVLVLTSGANRADEARVTQEIGEPVERADAEYVRARTGFAIGGVPPLGHDAPVRTLIDEDLLRHAEVWGAAGTPHAVFGVSPDELVRVTGGRVVSVAARGPAGG